MENIVDVTAFPDEHEKDFPVFNRLYAPNTSPAPPAQPDAHDGRGQRPADANCDRVENHGDNAMNDAGPSSPTIQEARPINVPGNRAAYVIHVVSNLVGSQSQILCPELSPALEQRVYDAARAQRDDHYRRAQLWAFVENKELPGLAIIDERLSTIPLPPCRPVVVHFEPVPLDETHPTIVELAELFCHSEIVAPLRRGGWAAIRRYGIRAGALGSVIIFASYAFKEIATRGFRALDFITLIGIALVVVGITQFLFWLATDFWILIPGGVVVRKHWNGRGRKGLRRYTPSTAMIFFSEKGPGWIAKICDQERVLHQCPLTRLECIVLLAAWQCPLPPPDMNKLVDLQ
jgi:hypothetical protein